MAIEPQSGRFFAACPPASRSMVSRPAPARAMSHWQPRGESGQRPFFVPAGEPKNGRFLGAGESAERLAMHGAVSEVALGRIDPDDFERVDFIKIDVEGAETLGCSITWRPVIEKFRPKLVCRGQLQTWVQAGTT